MIDSQDPNPKKTYQILKNEIYSYNADLRIKPIIVCKTKIDLEYQESEEWKQIEEDIIKISSISGVGPKKINKKNPHQLFLKKSINVLSILILCFIIML